MMIDEAIQKMIEEGKAKKYQAKAFNKNLKKDLKNDLSILQEIKSLWSNIKRDPKLTGFIEALSEPPALISNSQTTGLSSKILDPHKPLETASLSNKTPEEESLSHNPHKTASLSNKTLNPHKPSETAFKTAGLSNKTPEEESLLRKSSKATGEYSDFSVLRDKKNKLIVFTESKETAEYLGAELNKSFPNKVLVFTGSSSPSNRETIIENFDAKARYPKDDYRILIATELLSEGVNLHRSNVVINYDIPWNPTRLMQRVGRINRVDTPFDKIWIFNFFPTAQSNDIIKLKETAEAKIQAFISLLGTDARLLTEGEVIESHKLFSRLMSKKSIVGEDEEEESELKYLKIIKDIRDKEPDLFDKIKRLPKKARTARVLNKPPSASKPLAEKEEIQKSLETEKKQKGLKPEEKQKDLKPEEKNSVLETKEVQIDLETREIQKILKPEKKQTHIFHSSGKSNSPLGGQLLSYFRKGKIQKFFIAGESQAQELDFISSAKILEADKNAQQAKLPTDFYNKLSLNKEQFVSSTSEERPEPQNLKKGQDSLYKLQQILKAVRDFRQYTEDQEDYIKLIIKRTEEGSLSKQTAKTFIKLWKDLSPKDKQNPLTVLDLLKKTVPSEFLKSHFSEKSKSANSPREVILSKYLIKE